MSSFAEQVNTCLQVKAENIEEALYQFKTPMVEMRTREKVLERWPDIGKHVWSSFDEWSGYVGQTGYYELPGPWNVWSDISNCVVPESASEDELRTIRSDAEEYGERHHARVHADLNDVLYPDQLLNIATAVDRLVEVKSGMDDLIEDHSASQSTYAGSGQVQANVSSGGFKDLEDLFVDWAGGSDNDAAFRAFGDARNVAGAQRLLMNDIIQFTTAEMGLQGEARDNLGHRIESLVEDLADAQKDRDPSLSVTLTMVGTVYAPLGLADSGLSVLETLTQGEDGSNQWYGNFKQTYLTMEVETGITPDTFDNLLERLNGVISTVATMLEEGRAELKSMISERISDTSHIIQGED
jgi:hypothetical protein